MRVTTTPRNPGSIGAAGMGWVKITLYILTMIDRVWSCRFINISEPRHGAKRLWQMIDYTRGSILKPTPSSIWISAVWVRTCVYTIVCVYVSVVKGLPLISQNVKRYWKQPFPGGRVDRVNISPTPECNFPNNFERYLQYT